MEYFDNMQKLSFPSEYCGTQSGTLGKATFLGKCFEEIRLLGEELYEMIKGGPDCSDISSEVTELQGDFARRIHSTYLGNPADTTVLTTLSEIMEVMKAGDVLHKIARPGTHDASGQGGKNTRA